MSLLALVLLAAGEDPATQALEAARQAREQAKAGAFKEALQLFGKAQALDDRPEYGCNIGVVHYQLGNYPQAQLYLSRCLQRGGAVDGAYLEKVQAASRFVDKELRGGRYVALDLVVEPPSAIVTLSAFPGEKLPTPVAVWLPLGTHTLEATAPGHDVLKQPIEAKVSELRMRLKLTMNQTPAPPPPAATAPVAATTRVEPQDSGLAPYGIGALGGAVLALGAGVYFHSSAASTRTELEGMYAGPKRKDAVETLERQRALMIGGYALSAVLAAGGVLLLGAEP